MRKTIIFLIFNVAIGQVSGQTKLCDQIDKELKQQYSKIIPFYYGDQDSLIYYSDLFTIKITEYLKNNPSSIDCILKSFNDGIGSIVTTSDGLLRIYSWNTWTGGTMKNYKNLFQYKSEGNVYVKVFDYGEEDMGTYFTDAYSLRVGDNNTYILAMACGNESTKTGYELLSFYALSRNILSDNVALLKTPSGFERSILVEYEFSDVNTRSHLINYDPDKKIIYVPIISDNGKMTDKYDVYKFTGQCFEKIATKN